MSIAPPESEHIEDAEVVDAAEVQQPAAAAVPGTAIAVRPRTSQVIKPLDPEELVESFKAYQSLLPRILDNSDYQDAGGGKQFVKKSGWRKIATAASAAVIRGMTSTPVVPGARTAA